jgi:arsenate reductase
LIFQSRHLKTLDRFLTEPFDEVIAVCDQANEACPCFPQVGKRRHWSIADPAGVTGTEHERLEAFRTARDALRERIETELL